ncbi:tyrosine protein kinase [Desulfurobacterium thermolithotrophum DSM 11699]|uniref:Tyrosine protein kinase n=1 Tax=Desulfurobacterium thermolithotrophum (strain DSM 11699 / BSA) TaxID=868864 RepID=F0S346_DESTD|nr:tyrosine protein kinase [Desulfurobacterium thermolithotrophum]ADY73268.1 tyrosine protein kinase [Desulfurobacterium thermolithotrophum DSM 11699]
MVSQTSQFYRYLDYPAGREERVKELLKLLKEKNIELVSFISKGYRGVVFKGIYKEKTVAVKVSRSDVQKENFLKREYEILKYLSDKLKEENPAPTPFLHNSEFIVMEFIEGKTFKFAMNNFNPYFVIKETLKSCYLLDEVFIKHSEIKGEKHLIFDGKKCRIIDFESAKFSRSPRNLLQFIGYHLIKNEEFLKKLKVRKEDLQKTIELYKKDRKLGFKFILSLC